MKKPLVKHLKKDQIITDELNKHSEGIVMIPHCFSCLKASKEAIYYFHLASNSVSTLSVTLNEGFNHIY